MPRITGDLTGNNVFGCGFTHDSSVNVVVQASGGAQAFAGSAPTDGDGSPSGGGCFNKMLNEASPPVDLVPGMVITVTDNTTPSLIRTLTLADLTIGTIDVGTNTVSGHAPDGPVNVGAFVGGTHVGAQVTATGGAWSHDFSPADIIPSTNVNASVNDQDGDSTGTNRTLFNGSFNADLSHDQIGGMGFTPTSTVTVEVKESGTVVLTKALPTDANGNFGFDTQLGIDLVPGMVITVTDNATTFAKDLTLVALSITTINVDTNTVSGHAPAGVTVTVGTDVPGNQMPVQVTADTNGLWSHNFSPVDITVRTNVGASVNDADGDSTGFNLRLFGGWFNADVTSDQIYGMDFTPNNTVTVTVDSEVLITDRATDANGNFWFNTQPGVDLVPEMVITVTDNATTYAKVLTLANLTIGTIDPATDTVTGTAPAGKTVNVGADVGESWVGGQVTAGAGGTWSYAFLSADITPSTNVNASVSDEDGDGTNVNRRLFDGSLNADLTNNQIQGNGFTPDKTVTVVVTSGNTEMLNGVLPTDADGNFGFDTELGIDLVSGMVITVTDDFTQFAKDLTLVTLTIGTIDVATDTVTGTADAGAQVNVGADVGEGVGSQVTAGADGSWSYDFSPADITQSTNVNASVSDDDGDSTGVNRRLFGGWLNADLTNNQIQGNGFSPNAAVTVKVGSDVLNSNQETDPNGDFWFDTEPGYLVPGMDITVTDNATDYFKELTLVNLSIDTINTTTEIVSGLAPDGATVDVGADVSGNWVGGQATATGGTWSYDFSPADITPSTNVNASVPDGDGDSTSVNLSLFNGSLYADLTNSQISGNGFTPNSAVTVKVNDAVLSAEQQTDPEGNFSFDTQPGYLVPGMVITVTDNQTGFAKDLTLVTLTIGTIDVATDTVTGTAPEGAQVDVGADVSGNWVGGQATATGGTWSYDFSPADITPSTYVNASVNDGDGDSTGVNRTLFNGSLYANLTDDQISGDRFSPNATVTVQVTSPGGTVLRSKRLTADADGTFWFNPLTSSLTNLEAGMHVIATDRTTGYVVDLTLDVVTFDAFDTTTGVASGTGPPNNWVNVSIQNPVADGEPEQVDMNTQTNGAGAWTVDFDVPGGFESTAWASASVGNMAGGTGVNFKRPQISGNLTDDTVSGTDLDEAASVTVKILASGGLPLYSGTVTTDGSGFFTLARRVHRVDLIPGMQIVINAGTHTERTLTLVNLTITGATLEPFKVTGTAFTAGTTGPLVDSTVTASFPQYKNAAGDGGSDTVDTNGSWSVDTTLTAGPRANVSASVGDADGDTTAVNWVAPKPGKN